MKNSRLVTTAVAVALVASLCLPAVAMAAGPFGQGGGNGAGQNPGQGQNKGKGKGAGQAQGQGAAQGQENAVQNQEQREARMRERLVARVERMLLQRKAKFNRAEARLLKRIGRLDAIASKAASMGIDVTAAKAALEKAREQLKTAAAEELKAQEMFKAVLDAGDKRAAFAAARAQARIAQKALQRARLEVVNALRILHKAIDESGLWKDDATGPTTP